MADSARCRAAAEGTVVLAAATLGPRLGLTSVLLLREARPALGLVVVVVVVVVVEPVVERG